MAKPTRHTIANARRVPSPYRLLAGSGLIPSVGLWCTLLMTSCGMNLAAEETLATKPGAKSNYRSANHRDSDASSDSNDGRGVFGLGNLLGRKADGEEDRGELLAELPAHRLTPQAQARINAITERPTLYRRLPTQAINCDEDLFLFLTRKPEAIIGIWDLMDITNVQAERVGPYQFSASDGSGTTCTVDLIYGDRNLHVFVADGMYDGKFAQKPILGKGVFVLKSSYATAADGSTTVIGTLDCYVKFESLGADLIARSLGVLIGKSADHNFVETAKFISQISGASQNNPHGMLDLASQMPQVDEQTRSEFKQMIVAVADRHASQTQATRMLKQPELSQTPTPSAVPTGPLTR